MPDATFDQANRILNLIATSNNPHRSAQWLIENFGAVPDLANSGVNQATIREALKHLDPYEDEQVEPTLFYPPEYLPGIMEEQVERRLRSRLEWLDDSHLAQIVGSWNMKRYRQADGLYYFPKPTVLAARLGIEDVWNNFGLLIEQGPLSALASAWEQSGRVFNNWRAGRMGSQYYRLSEEAKDALVALEASQPGDILVIPANSGQLYAGYSVRKACDRISRAKRPRQWPLTSYVVGWMLYANPRRLEADDHLNIDCPGDQYSFEGDDRFDYSLCFYVSGSELGFDSRLLGSTIERFGSAVGFAGQ